MNNYPINIYVHIEKRDNKFRYTLKVFDCFVFIESDTEMAIEDIRSKMNTELVRHLLKIEEYIKDESLINLQLGMVVEDFRFAIVDPKNLPEGEINSKFRWDLSKEFCENAMDAMQKMANENSILRSDKDHPIHKKP